MIIAAVTAALLLLGTGCSAQTADSAEPAPAPVLAPPASVRTPIGLAVVGDSLWVASADANAVVELDAATGRERRVVPVGEVPLRLAVDGPLLWVSVFVGHRLVAVDTTTGRVVRTVELPDSPEGLAVAFDSLWTVRQDSGVVTRLSRDGDVITDIAVGQTPRLILAGPHHLWVANLDDGTLTMIDPATNGTVTSEPVCDGPQAMAFGPGGLWVTCTRSDEVVVVDVDTLTVIGRVAVTGEPDAVVESAGRVFVVATKGPTLVELGGAPTAPVIVHRQLLGDAPRLADRANTAIAVSDSRMYISSFKENAVHVLPLP